MSQFGAVDLRVERALICAFEYAHLGDSLCWRTGGLRQPITAVADTLYPFFCD